MARIPRVVIPGVPHHVIQRGNRRQRVFFGEADYQEYRQLMAEYCDLHDVKVLAYCLMPNHTHLVQVPSDPGGLARAVGEAHRRYTRHVNFTHGWRGYLWEGRFRSYPMDDRHCYRAVRYVERNPIEANLCRRPEHWPWSSAAAHLCGESDGLVDVEAMRDRVTDWAAYLAEGMACDTDVFLRHERSGRPLGSDAFVEELERLSGRRLRPMKAGRKPKKK